MSLREYIISDTNIYNAIYCLESYIFEKGLLSDEDLACYVRLNDKYDYGFIGEIIKKCQCRLENIFSSPDSLFQIKVYFKIKKWDAEKNRITYRPMHTAGLIDQICMVCMLLPLMFSDRNGHRERSELTKFIPHNFFGNIPSTDVSMLFEPWKKKYKEYNEQVILHCKEYQENHRYRTEITLDIKNFFPSISPEFIFNYALEKLKFSYSENEDKATLKAVLAKLLFFDIQKENMDGWIANYYGDDIDSDFYMNCGIPQGLPQSYFFGNLCMIEIYGKLKKLPIFKNEDSYFYVDDSVIYIEQPMNPKLFEDTIVEINGVVREIGQGKWISNFDTLTGVLPDKYINFQQKIQEKAYTIEFHPNGKSEYCLIEKADLNYAYLGTIHRAVSMASAVYSNLDEIEDRFSREKLENIKNIVDDEIQRLKSIAKPKVVGEKNQMASRLKILKRYKRFFLFRIKLLDNRLKGGPDEKDIATFCSHFHMSNKNGIVGLNDIGIEEWFDTYDEDIFQTEARMLISILPKSQMKTFLEMLCGFEMFLVGKDAKNKDYLFLSKDFHAAEQLRSLSPKPYSSLMALAEQNYGKNRSLSPNVQHKKLKSFIGDVAMLLDIRRNGGIFPKDEILGGFPEYTYFVFENSDEFIRKIINAFYSTISDVTVSDAQTFTKNSSRPLSYAELRILIRLRNRDFRFKEFTQAVNELDATNLENRMSIDMGLMDVVGLFIANVKRPEWIDNIILTHRVVKGLWYNGSKFLNAYTLHNEEHAITLVKWIVRITKAVDYLSIKRLDFYILFLACYLHDISMVLHPDVRSFCRGDEQSLSIITEFISQAKDVLGTSSEGTDGGSKDDRFKKIGHLLVDQFEEVYAYFENRIRSGHPKDSAARIKDWQHTVLRYLSPLLLAEVAKVSESHGYEADAVYGLKSEARNAVISEKYMMMLIRLADLLDVANDRINYYLLRQNVKHMNPTSQFHWISHLITDEIRVEPNFKVNDKFDEHGEQLDLARRIITETINVNLHLNVKYVSSVEPLNCKVCRMQTAGKEGRHKYHTDDDVELITLDMGSAMTVKPSNCPLLCKWTMLKHEWLVNELEHLQKYLNTVNNKLFRTEIRLNMLFHDSYHLDSDLFDSVHEYIQTAKVHFE